MPVESEIDPRVDQLEPPQFFIRTYNAEGVLQSEIPLKKYAPVYVGRALGCQIDLVEPSISRRHCVFQYKELIVDSLGNSVSGFMIYDLKSSHGTFLNSERIPSMENIKLNHGDKITLGQCRTVFTFWDSKYVEREQQILQQQSSSSTTVQTGIDPLDTEELEETLTQQPSSTSQAAESEAILNESDIVSDSWLQKYIKILDQLADTAKEYEEYGVPVPNFDMESRLAKKLKLEHTKLVKQAQNVAELLGLIGSDDAQEEEPPVKRRKRMEEPQSLEATPPKRARKGRKVELNESIEKEKKEVGAKSKDKRRRAQKVQKEDEVALVQNHSSDNNHQYDRPTENVLNRYARPSFEGAGSTEEEEDPLAITIGPKVEEMYEDDVIGAVDDMPLSQYRTYDETQADRVENIVKEPKKRGRKKKTDTDLTLNSMDRDPGQATQEPAKEKSRRGRKPKAEVKEVKQNKKEKTEKTAKKSNYRKTTPKADTSTRARQSSNKSANSPKKSTPLKPIDNNSPKRRRGRSQKDQRSSLDSGKIAVNVLIPPNIISSYGSQIIKQPIILVHKLEIQKGKPLTPRDHLEVENN